MYLSTYSPTISQPEPDEKLGVIGARVGLPIPGERGRAIVHKDNIRVAQDSKQLGKLLKVMA
jgi:hypothetical protein